MSDDTIIEVGGRISPDSVGSIARTLAGLGCRGGDVADVELTLRLAADERCTAWFWVDLEVSSQADCRAAAQTVAAMGLPFRVLVPDFAWMQKRPTPGDPVVETRCDPIGRPVATLADLQGKNGAELQQHIDKMECAARNLPTLEIEAASDAGLTTNAITQEATRDLKSSTGPTAQAAPGLDGREAARRVLRSATPKLYDALCELRPVLVESALLGTAVAISPAIMTELQNRFGCDPRFEAVLNNVAPLPYSPRRQKRAPA